MQPMTIRARYREGDAFEVMVRSHLFFTDQPVSDGGADIGPSPTELIAAGLATCVGFYAERYLRRHNLRTAGLEVECDYGMSDERPPRIDQFDVRVTLPEGFPEERKTAFYRVLEQCPVHNTLKRTPGVRIRMEAEQGVAR